MLCRQDLFGPFPEGDPLLKPDRSAVYPLGDGYEILHVVIVVSVVRQLVQSVGFPEPCGGKRHTCMRRFAE